MLIGVVGSLIKEVWVGSHCPLGHCEPGWLPPLSDLLQMCWNWQLGRRQERRLKSRQIAAGWSCWDRGGLVERLELRCAETDREDGKEAAGERKGWFDLERTGQARVRWLYV